MEGVFVSLVISGLQLLSGAQTMESRQLLERVVLKLAQADVRILLGGSAVTHCNTKMKQPRHAAKLNPGGLGRVSSPEATTSSSICYQDEALFTKYA